MALIPPSKLNGGLFIGDPFATGAPWANVPVRPSSAYMINQNLSSANPPPNAIFQMTKGYRPGNNTDDEIDVLNTCPDKSCIPVFQCTPNGNRNCQQTNWQFTS